MERATSVFSSKTKLELPLERNVRGSEKPEMPIKQGTDVNIERSHHASCVGFGWLLHYQFRRALPQAKRREKGACLSILQTSGSESRFSEWDASLPPYPSQGSDGKMDRLDERSNLDGDKISYVIYFAQRR
jgi:hypothetical protein